MRLRGIRARALRPILGERPKRGHFRRDIERERHALPGQPVQPVEAITRFSAGLAAAGVVRPWVGGGSQPLLEARLILDG